MQRGLTPLEHAQDVTVGVFEPGPLVFADGCHAVDGLQSHGWDVIFLELDTP